MWDFSSGHLKNVSHSSVNFCVNFSCCTCKHLIRNGCFNICFSLNCMKVHNIYRHTHKPYLPKYKTKHFCSIFHIVNPITFSTKTIEFCNMHLTLHGHHQWFTHAYIYISSLASVAVAEFLLKPWIQILWLNVSDLGGTPFGQLC